MEILSLEQRASRWGPTAPIATRHSPKHTRKVDIRLPEKGNSKSRGARPVYKQVDSDQEVVHKDLSLSETHSSPPASKTREDGEQDEIQGYLAHKKHSPPETLQ